MTGSLPTPMELEELAGIHDDLGRHHIAALIRNRAQAMRDAAYSKLLASQDTTGASE